MNNGRLNLFLRVLRSINNGLLSILMNLLDFARKSGFEPRVDETDAEYVHRVNNELGLGFNDQEISRITNAIQQSEFSSNSLSLSQREQLAKLEEALDRQTESADEIHPGGDESDLDPRLSGESSPRTRSVSVNSQKKDSPGGVRETENQRPSTLDDIILNRYEESIRDRKPVSAGSSLRQVLNKSSTVEEIGDSNSRYSRLFLALIILVGVMGTIVVTGAGSSGLSNSPDDAGLPLIGEANSTKTPAASSPLPPGTGSEGNSSSKPASTGPNGKPVNSSDPNSGSSYTRNQGDRDSDGDGIPNTKEIQLGLDPSNVDTDSDGLDDRVELNGPTNPLLQDTDNDSLTDGWEVDNELNATSKDTDGDGLDDGRELELGTNPLEIDTDADGVPDGREIELNIDPLSPDSDGDGLNDKREITGPSNVTLFDTDEDGLSDGREFELNTSPVNTDTDNDSLTDTHELSNGTDPRIADTDGDNLLDGWEVRKAAPNGAKLPEADPLRKDIYVQVSKSKQSLRIFDNDRAFVRAAFNEINVANPDGSTGIDVHFDDYPFQLPQRSVISGQDEAEDVLNRYSPNDYVGTVQGVGDREGIYHHVMLVRISEEAEIDTVAQSPGYRMVVDEDATNRAGSIPLRDRLIIRGLLQNIVGEPPSEVRDDDSGLTKSGWMASDPDDYRSNEFLSEAVKDKLEEEGFAE